MAGVGAGVGMAVERGRLGCGSDAEGVVAGEPRRGGPAPNRRGAACIRVRKDGSQRARGGRIGSRIGV